jgi:hypothetical protein
MAKRRGKAKAKSSTATGCALLIVIVIAIATVSRPKSGNPTPTGQSLTATEQGAKPRPSATITDTPSPAPTTSEVLGNRSGNSAQATPTKLAILVESMPLTAYMVRSSANARTCPDTGCEALGRLESGQTITVDGGVKGGDFQGSNVWVRTTYNGQTAYVHSSLVIESALVAQPEQLQSQIQSTLISQPVQAARYECNGINDLNCADFDGTGTSADEHVQRCGDEDQLDKEGDGDACEPGW